MPVKTESDGKDGLQALQNKTDDQKKDLKRATDQASTAAAHAAHKAHPGPVMADKYPEAASKEELKKRMEELNKN